jgi:uncharacterized Rmd1/YagE family protein
MTDKPAKIFLRAWYFRSTVDLRRVREKLKDFTLVHKDPLILQVQPGHWVVITRFGSVVFWPFEETLARRIAGLIQETLEDTYIVEEVEDRLLVEVGRDQQKVLFNEVWLPKLPTLEQVRVISNLLAQSVALEYLEKEVAAALQRFLPYLRELHAAGRVRISSREILRVIGFLGETRHAVLANLTLFDKPDVTWESEQLEQLYLSLFDMFDLPERHEAIEKKLQFLSDATSNLYVFLNTRKAHRLEWIVIILIAVELLAMVFYEIFK